ncbi:MAG: DUF3817 domain-containing protein [Crocinitomicaceae bacterium]|nr:DUF3817 domain-containing protein [Crocinitomicaceae bacterium]
MLKTNLGLLRIIGLLEGVSYLLLLFVAMPLKYFAETEDPVYSTGMAHGLLFSLYVIFVFLVAYQLKWKFNVFMLALIASVIPFGTFIADKRLFRKA